MKDYVKYALLSSLLHRRSAKQKPASDLAITVTVLVVLVAVFAIAIVIKVGG